MSLTVPDRPAQTSTPIHSVLAHRWSPRAFDATVDLDETKLRAALEAARWSASAANTQPWRFLVARRGTDAFATVFEHLQGANSAWAGSAGALIVGVTRTANDDGDPQPWAEYDLGQALAHFSVQAHHDGLHVHQMGGFRAAGIHDAFGLAEDLRVMSVAAVGLLGDAETLPEGLREREGAARTRLPLEELLLVDA